MHSIALAVTLIDASVPAFPAFQVWSNFHRTCLSPESMRLAKEVQGMRSLLPSELLKVCFDLITVTETRSN